MRRKTAIGLLAAAAFSVAASLAYAQMLAQPDIPPFRGMPVLTPLPKDTTESTAQAQPAPAPRAAPVAAPPQVAAPAPAMPAPSMPAPAQQAAPAQPPADMRQPPAAATPPAPVFSSADARAVTAAATAPRRPARALRHLPNNIQGYRLFGEIGSSEWPIYLTEAQANHPLRFQVGYLAAISAMPEASTLSVWINDKVIGQTRIFAPNSVKTAVFDVPRDLMRPGFNAVRISVEQRHRVDCSLQATYELWTQIDPSQTGLVIVGEDPGVTEIADLAALPPDAQGALPIRAVIPPRTSLANVEYVLRAVQMIALIGRFEQPLVDFGPMADDAYGINLAIGTIDEVGRQIGRVSIGPVTGPRLAVLPAQPGRRATILVTGVTQQDVEQALTQFAAARERRGSQAGLRAASAFPGYVMQGGDRVPLRNLGVSNELFSGRFFRVSFNIVMPPDFYPADYAKVFLRIDGGYAAGLTSDAHIMVAINDRNAASVNLPKSAGDVFQHSEIPVALGMLRPGLNRIELQAQVPFASDDTCDPLAAISGKKRFMFLDTSELVLPQIARIARMPDLAVTATGAFPFAAPGAEPKLFVPAPDKETMGAAATLVARLAVSAGRPMDFRLSLTPPPKGSGATLVVASAKALSPEMANAAGLDLEALRRVWQDRMDAPSTRTADERMTRFEAAQRNRLVLQRNFPAACHMTPPPRRPTVRHGVASAFDRAPVSATPAAGDVSRGAPASIRMAANQTSGAPVVDSRQMFEDWNNSNRAPNPWVAYAGQIVGGVSDWAVRQSGAFGSWVGSQLQSAPPPPGVSARTSLVMVQNILGDTTDDVWTFVTAPTSALLGESVGCLIDPRVWRQVDGRMSLLDASEGRISAVAATGARLVQTQPISFGNMRLIAASWLSLNSSVFVALSLLVAMALSSVTVWLIRNVGRKQET